MRIPHNDPLGADASGAPERRCILTGEHAGRDDLVRLAISPEGLVLPDALARAPGRGAWIGVDRTALETAVAKGKLKGALARAFKAQAIAIPDDLAQQIFLRVWLKIHTLKQASAFSGWLKRLAISVWLQHIRKNDALRNAREFVDIEVPENDTTGMGMDLDQALSTLPDAVRLCVVLSYHEGMSHPEVASLLGLPLGTVKSHINRGSQRLKELLSAYESKSRKEQSE